MLEIEVKARLRNPERVRKKLSDLGAMRVKTVTQVDTYYNHPARDFAASDEALRLRNEDGKVTVTYKGPKLDKLTKTREEENLQISEAKSAEKILERLGFRRVREVKKRREHYTLPGFKVMLDRVEGLGEFIEVEKPGEKYDPRELIEFLKSLGVDEKDLERRSYLELLIER